MIARYTETALSEIDEILSFIAQDNPAAAARVVEAIELSIDHIAEQPEAAPVVHEQSVRAKLVKGYPYRIFYQLRSDDLIIRNVRSTSRQLPWKKTSH